MADQIILLDTSVLIDYFRKSNKANTLLSRLVSENHKFSISVITHFEILRGITEIQQAFWWKLLRDIEVLSYFPAINYTAVQIQKQLKLKRKTISIEDLIIASTAFHLELPLATLNNKHFKNIDGLNIL